MDSLKVDVVGGNGGTGLPAYGGKGGKGGDVIFKCNHKIDSLKNLKANVEKLKANNKKFKSIDGENSAKYKLIGEDGRDLKIYCPPGCTIKNRDGGYIGEVDEMCNEVVLPVGGEGGCKENNYIGRMGTRMSVIIDLKLISDIGLVGYPNAGKSTLLKALTRAKPKIANFPFTTITPNIGVIEYPDLRKISVADLPGLIKGAHLDVGLGHKFLKHIIRTKLLIFVISSEQMFTVERKEGYSPIEILLTLIKEIELYDQTMLRKPAVLLMSKSDLPGAKETFEKFLADIERVKACDFSNINLSPDYIPDKLMKFDFILPVSSKTSWNIRGLQKRLREQIDCHFEEELIEQGEIRTFGESIEQGKNVKKKKKDDDFVAL